MANDDTLRAALRLKTGELVAFPTETVYGLGADATNDRAVARIYEVKGRPSINPLIIHFASPDLAGEEVVWNDRAEKLADAFWPGPLTLVLPRRKDSRISLLASAGTDTLGVRCPSHPLSRVLLSVTGLPVAAPSANRSGRVSPTRASHVRGEFSADDVMVLDGGDCEVGLESTVIALLDKPTILRPGSVTKEEIAEVLREAVGVATQASEGGAMLAPGMLASHYAPSLPVRLDATVPEATEALLAFGPVYPKAGAKLLNLSERGDLVEAAANLFAYLRELDVPEFSGIAVMPIPDEGLGIAINDRLKRAAIR